jgi:voltage-gated potassium channel
MPLFRQSSAGAVLVTLTLSVQSAGMARLIHWGRAHVKRGLHKLGPLRSAALVVRITHMMIVLHISQILLWAGFFRWNLFSIVGIRLLLFDNQLFDSRLW